MKVTLEDELKYVDRCVNPDYIIIVQNKADDHMDFSQFKIMGAEEAPVIMPRFREYTASCNPVIGEEGKLRVIVSENLSNGTVLAVVFHADKKDKWASKLKKEYGIKEFKPTPIIDYASFGDYVL